MTLVLLLLLTLLFHNIFVGEAFVVIVHIINTLPTKVLNSISPFQKNFNQKPNYTFFIILWLHVTLSYVRIIRPSLIFVMKYVYFWNIIIKIKVTSVFLLLVRHVVFNEQLFHFTLLDNPFHKSIKQTYIPSIYDNSLIMIQSISTTTTPASHTSYYF